jgi:hypothetical protein
MFLVYDAETGAICGQSTSEPINFPGHGHLAVFMLPDLAAYYVAGGVVQPRMAIDWAAIANDAWVSTNGGTAATGFVLPTAPGTWELVAVGKYRGEKTITIRSVPEVRSQLLADMKAARDTAEWAGCDAPLGRVDTDPDSQRKIAGAALAALIAHTAGQPFSVTWTMQDNSNVLHDAPATIAMGVAVGEHVAACHSVGRAMRSLVESTDDAAALASIDVRAGWPA